jgi:hypothetical protein
MRVNCHIVLVVLLIAFALLLSSCASTLQEKSAGVIEIEKIQVPPGASRVFIIKGRSVDIPYGVDLQIGMRIREIDYLFGDNLVRRLRSLNLRVYDNLDELEKEKDILGEWSGRALVVKYRMTDYKLNSTFGGTHSLGGVTFEFDLEMWEGKQPPYKGGQLRSSCNFIGTGESALSDMLNEVAKYIVSTVYFGSTMR